MDSPLNQKPTVNLGGKQFPLSFERFDFASAEYRLRKQGYEIALISPGCEEFWSELVRAAEADGTEGVYVDQFRVSVLLFTGICRTDPKLTLEQAGDMIDFDNLAEVSAIVAAAAIEAVQPLIRRGQKQAQEAAKEDPLPGGSTGDSRKPSDELTSDSLTPAGA